MKDSQPFTKLKEVFCFHTSQLKNTTFNFAQSHLKSTVPNLIGRLTIWRKLLKLKHLKNVSLQL